MKRQTVLLAVIYMAFISLGLPDSILGVVWPGMRTEMGLPLESMGILTTLLMVMSAVSSVMSGRLLRRFGTGGITFVSGVITGIALLGYSFSTGILWLVVFTIPLGLGQGAVDSGLNLYVAEHYSARHMNWLHCFWGVGASLSPLIMTHFLLTGGWRVGYRTISGLQLGLSGILLAGLLFGLWQKEKVGGGHGHEAPLPQNGGLRSKSSRVLAVFLFFLYTGIEYSGGVWLSSVLLESRGKSVQTAGLAVTLYYGAIMAGRFLSGIVVDRIGNMRMLRIGMLLAVTGGICTGISGGSTAGVFAGTVMTGIGDRACACISLSDA